MSARLPVRACAPVKPVAGAGTPDSKSTRSPKGSMVHAILEQFILEAVGDGHPFGGWSAADRARLKRIATTASTMPNVPAAGPGAAVARRTDRLERQLEVPRHRLRTPCRRFRPVAQPKRFDDVAIALPQWGHILHVHSVRRWHRPRADGSVEVIDYKTGSTSACRETDRGRPAPAGAAASASGLGSRRARRVSGRTPEFSRILVSPTTRGTDARSPTRSTGVLDAMDPSASPVSPTVSLRIHRTVRHSAGSTAGTCAPDGLGDAHAQRESKRITATPR